MKKSRREDNELYFDSCNGCIQGSEMLPKFGVIALVVVIILIGMFIYAKKKK